MSTDGHGAFKQNEVKMVEKKGKTALICGENTEVCREAETCLKEMGWLVWRLGYGEVQAAADLFTKEDGLDLLIFGDDEGIFSPTGTIYENQERPAALQAYEQHVNGPLKALRLLKPLLDQGGGRRICYITTRDSSNNMCFDHERYGEHMVRAARNMQAKIQMNRLGPEGYTFRVFCYDGSWKMKGTGQQAVLYFLQDRSRDEICTAHEDERRLVMRDEGRREIPW